MDHKNSPSRLRFRPLNRLTLGLRLQSFGSVSIYLRSVLGAIGNLRGLVLLRKALGDEILRFLRSREIRPRRTCRKERRSALRRSSPAGARTTRLRPARPRRQRSRSSFGRRSSLVPADFAFRFAAILLTVHTAQPRRAFRLLMTLMARGYPPRQPSTHKGGRRPPSGVLWREGLTRAERRPGPDRPRPEDARGRGNLRSAQRTALRGVLGEERRERVRQRHVGESAQRDSLCALAAVEALAVVALARVGAEGSALAS